MVAVHSSQAFADPVANPLSQLIDDWVDQVSAVDSIRPFNDLGMRLLAGSRPAELFWIGSADRLDAVAAVDSADGSVQLAVHPNRRRRGLATALATAVIESATTPPTTWWSFGTLAGAEQLAGRLGLTASRQLFKMTRDLRLHPAPATQPTGQVLLRPFTDADAEAVVHLNARAFADHPEQGAMTVDDLRLSMAENWFDADDLVVAISTAPESAGAMMGFHWMKREPDHPGEGEVYVLGVDPDFERRGLGRLLLTHGLHHLATKKVERVHLFVEAANSRVVGMYESANFGIELRDTAWTPAAGAPTEDTR